MTAYKEELRTKIMKLFKHILGAGVLVGALTLPNVSRAADQAASAKAKPYPLQVCIVSDAKLGSMGAPYVFVHEGQEFKLCCKGCLKGFNKEPGKFVKKLSDSQEARKRNAVIPGKDRAGHAGKKQ